MADNVGVLDSGGWKNVKTTEDTGNVHIPARNLGQRAKIDVTPTVTVHCPAAAYQQNGVVGGKLSFTNATRTHNSAGALGGRINRVTITDKEGSASANRVTYDLILFDSDISGSSHVVDGDVLELAAADTPKQLGFISISNWSAAFLGGAVAVTQPAFDFVLATGTTLYGVLVNRSATGPTFTATGDLQIRLEIQQD